MIRARSPPSLPSDSYRSGNCWIKLWSQPAHRDLLLSQGLRSLGSAEALLKRHLGTSNLWDEFCRTWVRPTQCFWIKPLEGISYRKARTFVFSHFKTNLHLWVKPKVNSLLLIIFLNSRTSFQHSDRACCPCSTYEQILLMSEWVLLMSGLNLSEQPQRSNKKCHTAPVKGCPEVCQGDWLDMQNHIQTSKNISINEPGKTPFDNCWQSENFALRILKVNCYHLIASFNPTDRSCHNLSALNI